MGYTSIKHGSMEHSARQCLRTSKQEPADMQATQKIRSSRVLALVMSIHRSRNVNIYGWTDDTGGEERVPLPDSCAVTEVYG